MKLALIRHGITAWNLEKRIQGRTDLGLSEAGRQRLAQLRIPDRYREFDWYCSPLGRARESARILGIDEASIEARLIEMSWGDWEGEILKPLRKRLGDVMRDNESRGLDFCPPGGESPRQVQLRLQGWMEELTRRGRDSGAVTHKGIIRCVYALARGWDMRGDAPIDFDWEAMHLFELGAGGRLGASYEAVDLRRGGP